MTTTPGPPPTVTKQPRARPRHTRPNRPTHPCALARYYDPAIGRFTATDPLVDLGRPSTLDAYGYAGGSPVTMSDPSGLLMTVGSGGKGDYTYGAVYTPSGRVVGGNPSGRKPAWLEKVIDQFVHEDRERLKDPTDPVRNVAVDSGWTPQVQQDLAGLLFRALLFDERECNGLGKDCGWQIFGLLPWGKGKKADDAIDAFRILSKGDEAADAAGVIARNLDDPSSLRGATADEVEALIPGWTKSPTSGPGGVRYANPQRRGEAVRVMPGNPRDPNLVKRGPYVRVSRSGDVSDPIPLAGNPQAG